MKAVIWEKRFLWKAVFILGIWSFASPWAVADAVVTSPPAASSEVEISAPRPVITHLQALSQTSFLLQWQIPEGDVREVRIYRDRKLVATVGPEVREFKDCALAPNTVYTYAVGAIGSAGETLSQPISDTTRLPNETKRETRVAFDVVVVGATPGGIAAALSAARLGDKVALVSPSPWLGGMMTGGLSRTDFGSMKSSGGLFKEFADNVRRYYETTYGVDSPQLKASRNGYYFEPRVAKWVFHKMLAQQPNLTVMLNHHSQDVKKQGNRVTELYVLDRPRMIRKTLVGKVFIDATYEGDLAAHAGAAYRIGREGKEEFQEEHAGEIFWDPVQRKVHFGSGKGDRKVQAYNYRLTLTRRAENLIPFPAPSVYNRDHYVSLLPDIASGRVKNLEQVMSILPLPEEKFDANNHPLGNPSTDLIGGSDAYPESDLWKREPIAEAHVQHILGLLHFVQYDPEVPLAFRQEALRWGLAGDEFVDNNHFPTQLYVREGRRIVGRETFTENDARSLLPEHRPNFQPDSIAVADYPIDSHATSSEKDGLLEGFFYLPGTQTQPSQVPFGVMTPLGLEGIIVSVCVSSSHIGYGTLRMEPVFISLGTAAGVAAHLAIRENVAPAHLNRDALQMQLLQQSQVICVFDDVPLEHPHWAALQYLGTKGFFPEYKARPDAAVTRAEAVEWLWKWIQAQKPELQAAITDTNVFSDLRADQSGFIAAHSLLHWKVLVTAPELRPDSPVTQAEAKEWLSNAMRVLGWPNSLPANSWGSDAVMTRAELCQRIYDAQSSRYASSGPARGKK